MKDWVFPFEGDKWSVKFDVRDLGGHLDTTFRGWSSTLAARVRLVISRLVLIFALHLDFHGRVRVVRSMYLPAAFRPSVGLFGLVVSPKPVLVLCLAFWMGLLGVILPFVSSGFGFGFFDVILLYGPLRLVVFIVFLRWSMKVALVMVPFIFSLLALLRLVFNGTL